MRKLRTNPAISGRIAASCCLDSEPCRMWPVNAGKAFDCHLATTSFLKGYAKEFALIAITTGMSIKEICGLQWKQINLERITKDCEDEAVPRGRILLKRHWYPDGIVDLHVNRIRLIEIPHPLSITFLRWKQKAGSPEPDAFVVATSTGHQFGLPPFVRCALAFVACSQAGSRCNLVRVTDSTELPSGFQYLMKAEERRWVGGNQRRRNWGRP